MTFTFKQISNGEYYINIEQEKFSCSFTVNLCEEYASGMVRTIKKYTYDTMQKANRRYNQLVKAYIYEQT